MAQQRVQHLRNRHDPIVLAPVHLSADQTRRNVPAKMSDRFFGGSARCAQKLRPVASRPAAHSFANVGADRLRAASQLIEVNEPGRAGDDLFDVVRHEVGGVENVEVAMRRHAA
ncbi:MAG TPA: hypothetical protein VHB25_21275 [Gemmatimonadaceae bacterium]|nr:hypothetical protein [Gemmatimonadaceae bacterium]